MLEQLNGIFAFALYDEDRDEFLIARYPDYYGIDMARLEEFCAFRATMALIEERGLWQLVNDVYIDSKQKRR